MKHLPSTQYVSVGSYIVRENKHSLVRQIFEVQNLIIVQNKPGFKLALMDKRSNFNYTVDQIQAGVDEGIFTLYKCLDDVKKEFPEEFI